MSWKLLGNTKIVDLLQHSLERKNVAHAYLIAGPPHVGKMTLALNLAQALNCRSAQPPCGECDSCKKTESGKHADIQMVKVGQPTASGDTRSKTEISIEQIREVLHTSNLPPFEGLYRVYIIEEAERLSNEAANCLLKTLEEPAQCVVFILLTSNDKLLLPTVISRCQRLELDRLTTSEVESALVQRWGIEPVKAKLLARLCQGCPGWAWQATNDGAILTERAEKLDKLNSIIRGTYADRFDYAAQLALQFGKKRESVYELLDTWLCWWRDVLLVKTGCPDGVINIDYLNAIIEIAGGCTLAQIKGAIRGIQAAAQQLKQNAGARLVLEVLMLDMPVVSSANIEVKHA